MTATQSCRAARLTRFETTDSLKRSWLAPPMAGSMKNDGDGRSALGCELGDEVARTLEAGSKPDDEGPPWSAHLRRRDQTRSVSVPDDGLADTRKPRGCPQLCPRLTVAEVGLVDVGVSETKIGFR